MQTESEILSTEPGAMLKRWAFTWREVAVLLVLAYFTPIGGTRAGTYHFPLVVFSHLLATVFIIIWTMRSLPQGRWLPKTPLDLPLLVFYVLNVVSTLFSTEPRLSLENLVHLTIFVLIYYIVVDLLVSGWTMSTLVRPMLVIGSVIIIVALLELALWLGIWFMATGEVSPMLALGDYRRRIVMGPANVLAWYVVLLMPLALARLLTPSSLRVKANLGAWVLGATLVFASTLSRSGLVGMAVAVASFVALAALSHVHLSRATIRSSPRNPAVIMGGAVLCTVAAAVLGALALPLVNIRTGTVIVRFELWRAAAEIIVRRPLLGGGPGTFGYLFHQLPDFNRFIPDMFYNNAHNGFINVAAETGLPGLVAGLWLLWALVRTLHKTLTGPGEDSRGRRIVYSACLAGILGLLAATMFDVPWVFPLITLHVVLLAAIIAAPRSSPRSLPRRPAPYLMTLAVGVMVGFMLWSDGAHYFQHRAVKATDDDNLAAAVDSIRTAMAIDPFLSIYRFQLGASKANLALQTNDIAVLRQATDLLEEEISRGGDAAINNGNLAWLEWNLGEAEQAAAHMQRAASQAPGDSDYKLGLGYLLEEGGDYEAARDAYASAIARSPELIDSAFWRTSEFRREFKSQLPAGEELPLLARASAAYFARDYPMALQLLAPLQSSVKSRTLRGRIGTDLGAHDTALEDLDAALAMSRANPSVYLARGQLYLRLDEKSKALHDLRLASLLGSPGAYIALGEIAYQAGELDKAIALYEGGIPGCRQVASSYDYASQVYHRLDLKADFWPELIVCAPYDSLVPEYLHLASAYRETGDTESADKLCRWLAAFYDPADLSLRDEWPDSGWGCPNQLPQTFGSVEPAKSVHLPSPDHHDAGPLSFRSAMTSGCATQGHSIALNTGP